MKVEDVAPSMTSLGMPIAQYVEDFIVDPMTNGLHNVLRTTAQHHGTPTSPSLPAPITSQIDLSLNRYPQVSQSLAELRQIVSEKIDMATLIRLPAELFLSENEWAGARWKEEKMKEAEEEKARALGLEKPDIQDAGEYLAFAIKSHQEAQGGDGSGMYVQEGPEVLQYVLDHVASIITELDASRQDGSLKSEGEQVAEDARLREVRLNLLALAKRAPLDKIARLPADLVPEHIRHFVPTLAPTTAMTV